MKKILGLLPALIFAVLVNTNKLSAQYCFPTTTRNPSYGGLNFYIDRVRLADIDNQDSYTPADTSYNDYTLFGPWTNLSRGSVYTMTINAGPNPTYYASLYYAAWIDFNNDGDFTDAGENLFQHKGSVVNEVITKSITIPSSAKISKTRLRVRCTYSSNAITVDPCVTYTYGESEDYTVGISDFSKVATTIPGSWDFDLEFFNIGDDGDYDLILLDEFDAAVPVIFQTNNGSGTFSSYNYINSVTPVFSEYNMSFNLCDLNNDNGLDLLLTSRNGTSTPRTTYFQKNGTQIYQTPTGIANLMWGSSATADFNNDGRQDIVICGRDAGNIPRTFIYMNTLSGFVLVNEDLKGVYGEIAVADYDNDMDVDILLTGTDRYGNSNSIIYRNDNNWIFTNIYANIYKNTSELEPHFCDFNNDGRLDLLCGKAYRNDGNGVFTEIYAYAQYDIPYLAKGADIDNDGILEVVGQADWGVAVYKYNGTDSLIITQHLMGMGRENLDIADINGDRKQDIIVNDYPTAYLFINQITATNNIPTAPPELTSSIGDSGFYSVSLKWKPGTDDRTPVNGLTYNLRVGTSPGGNQVFSSMTAATTNNPLLNPGMGNVYTNRSWFLRDLSPGTYYWSVQTVDNSGLASAFATEKQFTIVEPLTLSSVLINGRINQSYAGADLDGDKDIDLIIKDAVLTIEKQTAPYTYSAVPLRANCDLLGIGDINNDNLPDLIVKHLKQTGELADSLEIFVNLGNMNFTTLKIDTLAGAVTVAAADFDNDGDIDILSHTWDYFMFENTGSLQFNRTKLPIAEKMYRASLSPIDVDRDGDFDFLATGKESSSFSSSKCNTFLYKNDGDMVFNLFQTIIPGVGTSSFNIDAGAIATIPPDISWNDFNFDNYPDLLLTGDDEYKNSTNQIFLNDGTGMLITTSLSPRPADRYSSSWIDFNTDGYLDIIIPRIGYIVDNSIYFNNNNTSFEGFSTAIDNINFPAFIKAIDVDNDKDKDILVTNKIDLTVGFRTETVIYTNTNNFVNQAPTPPTGTSSEIDVFDVILNWNNGWDKLTRNNGLTYNIRVGTADNNADIISPMADLITGYRYVEALGNVGTNISWRIKNLPLGTYYWSVQTIDNSLTPSSWAPVKSFTLSALTANFENDTVCLGMETHITDLSITTHPITSWNWYFAGGQTSTEQNPVIKFTKAGNNLVKLVVESSVAKDSIIKIVYVKNVPDASFTNTTVCTGTATTFTNTTNANGLTMSEWHWDFGDNSGSNIQNPGTHGYLVAGSYSTILVTVADNGCSDTISKSVDVGIVPTAAVTLNGPPNFCSGDSVKLLNSYTDTFLYNWQNGGFDITGAVTNSYTAKLSGTYAVKVTNPVGNCSSVSSPVIVTVKDSPLQPAIGFTGDTTFCEGLSLLLTVPDNPDLIYRWKLNGGSIGTDTSMHSAKISGVYNLIVTNSAGCSVSSTNFVNITVLSRPVATSINPPAKTELCEGETASIGVTAFPGYSYQWLNNNVPVSDGLSNIYKVYKSGSYQLEISNSDRCSILTNSINITVNQSPVKPIIDVTGYSSGMCSGARPISLKVDNAISEYSYYWFKNNALIDSTATIVNFFEDGTYHVEADLNGCKEASDPLIMNFKPSSLPKPDITAIGTTVWYLTTSTEAEYYKWYRNGEEIPGANDNLYIAGQQRGAYRVSISNDNDCYKISNAVTIPTPLGTTGIEDKDPFEDVRVYPNPSNGLFTVEMNNNVFGELIIDIFAQNGRKMLNIKFEKTTEHFMSQIDLSGQSRGLYILNLTLDKFRAVRKILLE